MMGFVLLFIPIPIFLSYIILLVTSSYSISYLVLLKRNDIITRKQFRIYLVLQLCFVLDIIGIIYISNRVKKMSNVA
jgi:hypothetical protein